jgi:hypothetical protein
MQDRVMWDADKLMSALTKGLGRVEFLQDLARLAGGVDQRRWAQLCERRSPFLAWRRLVQVVREAASAHFVVGRNQAKQDGGWEEERNSMLAEKRRLQGSDLQEAQTLAKQREVARRLQQLDTEH